MRYHPASEQKNARTLSIFPTPAAYLAPVHESVLCVVAFGTAPTNNSANSMRQQSAYYTSMNMFDTHQPIIGAWARERPAHLREVLRFAVLSARQPLYNLPADMEQAHRGGPEAMGVLFGWKHRAWVAAEDNQDAIYAQCLDLWEHSPPEHLAPDLILYLAQQWGLGPAKAGFVAQMAFGVGGCLDTHNLRRFGLREVRGFRQLKSLRGRRHMIERYCAALATCGSTRTLWDSWCHYVANQSRRQNLYHNAEHVSALHCISLGLSPGQ